ncbi:MAG: hypothetical protein QXN68_05705 [Thermoplasmata archaeon]
MTGIFKTLWDTAVLLLSVIGDVWEWLSNEVSLGFTVFGWEINLATFVPIEFLGYGILALLLIWFIKGLVPMA